VSGLARGFLKLKTPQAILRLRVRTQPFSQRPRIEPTQMLLSNAGSRVGAPAPRPCWLVSCSIAVLRLSRGHCRRMGEVALRMGYRAPRGHPTRIGATCRRFRSGMAPVESRCSTDNIVGFWLFTGRALFDAHSRMAAGGIVCSGREVAGFSFIIVPICAHGVGKRRCVFTIIGSNLLVSRLHWALAAGEPSASWRMNLGRGEALE